MGLSTNIKQYANSIYLLIKLKATKFYYSKSGLLSDNKMEKNICSDYFKYIRYSAATMCRKIKILFKRQNLLNVCLKDIFDSLRLIVLLTTITGIFYLKINKNTQKVSTDDKKLSAIFTLVFVLGYASLYVFALMANNNTKKSMKRNFYYSVKEAFNAFCIGSTYFQVIFGYFIKSRFAPMLNSLASFDYILITIIAADSRRRNNILQKTFNKILFVEGTFFILKCIFFIAAFKKPWLVYSCVGIYHLAKNLILLMVLFLLLHFYVRFDYINTTIESVNTGDNEKLDKLCRLHSRLCQLSRRLNKLAILYFMYSYAVALWGMLFFSYHLYYSIREMILTSSKSFEDLSGVLFGGLVFLEEIFNCCLTAGVVTLLCNTANETPIYLHKLRYKGPTIISDKQIETISMQFLHQRLSFTVWRYFNINFEVLQGMFGTTLTYLVLFIQQDHSTSNNVRNKETQNELITITSVFES